VDYVAQAPATSSAPACPGPRPAPARRATAGEARRDYSLPAINLVLYHGVLAPHAPWRSQVVRYGRAAPDFTACSLEASPPATGTPNPWTWAALMRRVFDLDVLAWPVAVLLTASAAARMLGHFSMSLAWRPPWILP
jgi:hypothetical protein